MMNLKGINCNFLASSRSPVFQAMFISDMEETKSGTVKVEDVHPDVMTEILQYVYTGNKYQIAGSIQCQRNKWYFKAIVYFNIRWIACAS